MAIVKNSLLHCSSLPPFANLKTNDMFSAIKYLINENTILLKKVEKQKKLTWKNFIYKLEESDDKISKAWAPIRHLNSVMNDKNIRRQYDKSLRLLTEHYGKIGQNGKLFKQYERFYKENNKTLNIQQRKLILDTLRSFRLSGVGLDAEDRNLFRKCKERISELESKFEQNILDSTNSWFLNFNTQKPLTGLPLNSLEIAAEVASFRGEKGYTLTLDQPCYTAVMTYAKNSNLRKKMYMAYISRASKNFPIQGDWDNTKIIEEILSLRQKVANILGFKNMQSYRLKQKWLIQLMRLLNSLMA